MEYYKICVISKDLLNSNWSQYLSNLSKFIEFITDLIYEV